MKVGRHSKNFEKFLIVGITWTILSIFFMWLLIDFMKLPTTFGAGTVIIANFIGKYLNYIIIGFLKQKTFIKYTVVQASFATLNFLLMILLVEFIGLTALISSTFLAVLLFILRFTTFNCLKIVK
jgi:putative flippase GtrA